MTNFAKNKHQAPLFSPPNSNFSSPLPLCFLSSGAGEQCGQPDNQRIFPSFPLMKGFLLYLKHTLRDDICLLFAYYFFSRNFYFYSFKKYIKIYLSFQKIIKLCLQLIFFSPKDVFIFNIFIRNKYKYILNIQNNYKFRSHPNFLFHPANYLGSALAMTCRLIRLNG